jgi:hypothetical protein
MCDVPSAEVWTHLCARAQNPHTTNLGVRSSNLFGRANKIRHFVKSMYPENQRGYIMGTFFSD